MKKATFALILVGLLALGGSAFAEICAIDTVPAASLLLPYFEVDLDGGPEGFTTLFSVNNASAAATIAHVILWTNWSEPTIDFDIFLTGYDIQTVNLRDVFNGTLPITLHEREDFGDVVSPHQGAFANNPQWDSGLAFASCDPLLPYPDPVVTGGTLTRLRNGHTGQFIASIGGCLGADLGDNIARGYITIDDADDCSLALDPAFPGYFIEGGNGIATDENQLWGDYFYIDLENNFAQGEALVHIEADPLFVGVPETLVGAGDYTFYGRYTLGADDREPLGTAWGARYLSGNDEALAFDGTDFVVWRDSTSSFIANGLACGNTAAAGPAWFPLNETEVIAFNEREDAVELCFFQGGIISPGDEDDPACFPYETGRYPIGPRPHPFEGSPNPLDPPFQFGWMYLNLNLTDAFAPGDVDFGVAGNIAQSFVTVLHQAEGRFSVGLEAVELSSACDDASPTIQGLPTTSFIPEVQGGIN